MLYNIFIDILNEVSLNKKQMNTLQPKLQYVAFRLQCVNLAHELHNDHKV